MITRQLALAACATVILSVGSAYAGPCNTRGKDAGSGPTPGATASITTGSVDTKAHPPTATMNRAAGKSHVSAGRSEATAGPAHGRSAGPGRQAIGKTRRSGLLNSNGDKPPGVKGRRHLRYSLVESPTPASPPPGAETRTSCPCRSAREAAATAASKAASFVSYLFSAFPSWRTRHSASLPMIS